MSMPTYPKIDTLFDRDPATFKVDTNRFRRPEFELISHWAVQEKVDGTNIRLGFSRVEDYLEVEIGGRSNNAQIPAPLLAVLEQTCKDIHDDIGALMVEHELDSMVLFGEGYGPKIQKGGGNYSDVPKFTLFDIKTNGTHWLNLDAVYTTAAIIGLDHVPYLSENLSTDEVVELARSAYPSTYSTSTIFAAEGIIARPRVNLYDQRGHRVMFKLKHKDF